MKRAKGSWNGQRGAASLLLLAAVVGLLLWLRREPRPAKEPLAVEPTALHRETGSEARLVPGAPLVPDALRTPKGDPPIIDEISVEKSVVCEGEENLVTVRAHAPDPRDDGYLRYVVAGQPGSQVPIRSYRNTSGLPRPPQTIQVIGRSDATTTEKVPDFTVRDCKTPHALLITLRAMPNTIDEYEFVMRIVDSDPRDRFVPTRYGWDFGDGTFDTSWTPSIVHRYDSAGAVSLYSRFLLTAEASDAKGNKLVGRLPVNLLNSEFENLKYKGILVLSYSMTPRFPQADGSGIIEQKIKIWHGQRYIVKLTKIIMNGQLDKGEGVVGTREIDPVDLLGTNMVPPEGIEATVRFDTRKNEKIAMVDYAVAGESPEGTPAVLQFSIMRPPPVPTRENSVGVVDPLLNAKILKTREVMQKEFVTDEDIMALERAGVFENLKADPNFKVAALDPPANLPKAPQRSPRSDPAVDPRSPAAPAAGRNDLGSTGAPLPR